ncbi:DUF4352 domain-containing protein [Pontibacillus salipaludis]|uniref:DUF4352 domain-containing protein n=1 Tax=Pontibacillus salipaludis TaxID=1697394 RepID=A0ABQ1QDL7_9BACI|nr:DUF4352 domain-containing protein [Pontibacillus salipaludis]GGD21929.1 hypothetical protein GCM10011389_32000 [Pontibacillus salipaludis]
MKLISKLILPLILIIVVTACSSDNQSVNDSNEPSDDVAKTSTEEGEGLLSVGETHHFKTTIGNFKMTLDRVEDKKAVDGQESLNGEFIIPTFTIENTGDKSVKVESIFSTIDIKTRLFMINQSTVIGEQEKWWNKAIKPGETVSGKIYYDMDPGEMYEIKSRYVTADMQGTKTIGWEFLDGEIN